MAFNPTANKLYTECKYCGCRLLCGV